MAVPALVETDPDANLTDLVVANAAEAADQVGFRYPSAGSWRDITWAQFHTEVRKLARGLIKAGIGPGDRIGLMSTTRYEWTLADFAIWFAGAITVPIYETCSTEQVSWILSDSGAVACVVETERHAATVSEIRRGLAGLRELWVIESGGLDDLASRAEQISDQEIEARRSTLRASSIATLIYTSGTTGRPKGCELTHANFHELAANAAARLSSVVCAEGASTLLFLPLAHVFARFIQILCVQARVQLGHSADVKNLPTDLATFRPSFVLAVPRVFEKVYNSAESTAESGGKGWLFHAAADTAIAWSRAQDAGDAGLMLRLRHALFDKLVYGKLRAALGGRVSAAVSGGAPLSPRLGHFFRGVGVTILEGWGLTETTAPATVNCPEQIKIGTVGQPLPGVTVRVADDGELLVKGINVMAGYFNDPRGGEAALEGDWFQTGDLGEIDDDGFVRITGRKKELIVTSGGKNVIPTMLEDRLRAHPLVSQCIIVGDQRPFIACLVTLDPEMLPTWLSNRNRPALSVAAAAADPEVQAEVQLAVDHANHAVSKAESIRKFIILETDFTEAGGHLTPKLSLKRAVVVKEFATQVEQLYA